MRLTCLLLLAGLHVAAPARAETPAPALHRSTAWTLAPSLKLDALCLLNALSGDPYYLSYYREEYEHFAALLPSEALEAARTLKRVMKDEGGGIVSARLTLLFSLLEGDGLPDLLRAVDDAPRLEAALRASPYWSADDWRVYEATLRPALRVALRALERAGLEAYWREHALPRLERRIGELEPHLPRFDVVPVIEARLGRALPSGQITVYVLAWSEPHGIRVSGCRFITHVSYSFEIVLRTAIHEMMHPPYDATRPCVAAAIRRLGGEPTLRRVLASHDRNYGYNSVAGYVEEDSVQALEAVLDERFGVGRDPRAYWKQQDGGMHVLALAIYRLLQRGDASNTPYETWLCRAVNDGTLGAAALERAAAELR